MALNETSEAHDHLDSALAGLESLVRRLATTPKESPSPGALEYVTLRRRHLDELLKFEAARQKRQFVSRYDLTEDQQKSLDNIEHYCKILDALYGPKEA